MTASVEPTPGRRPPLEAVIFDFDGVILESTEIKNGAFLELFSDHPEHHERILEHHRENLGISRFRKFAWISRNLFGRELSEGESERLGERFSAIVLERALACPLVAGAAETLEWLQTEGIPAFVASGTPQEELELIVARRRLGHWLAEVHGSPRGKPRIIREIVRRHGFDRGRLVMVGDGLSDHRAAVETGIGFVARITPDQRELFSGAGVPEIPDLIGLPRLLARWPVSPDAARIELEKEGAARGKPL